jgi:ribosomal protein RSM22 (predicted rRNA methylase)
MRLPQELAEAIQAEIDKVERRRLVQATAEISERYQAGDFSSPVLATDAQRAAYLAVRFPATYAACLRVFSEIRLRAPQVEIAGMLDLGAGPGTALLAAAEIFPALRRASLVENDDRWISMGKSLARHSPREAFRQAQWLKQDLRSGFQCDAQDLVAISYALGELAPAAAEAVVRKAWSCARQFLIVMEPGTPRGFAHVNAARSVLIAGGAEILAPCPHKNICPLAAAGDWCHFSQRVERSSQHRQLKGGVLGYEDEKFSYVIAGRQSAEGGEARIVRHPGRHSGHVQLVLCTPQGRMENRTVTRSSGPSYKLARKVGWGDTWKEQSGS